MSTLLCLLIELVPHSLMLRWISKCDTSSFGGRCPNIVVVVSRIVIRFIGTKLYNAFTVVWIFGEYFYLALCSDVCVYRSRIQVDNVKYRTISIMKISGMFFYPLPCCSVKISLQKITNFPHTSNEDGQEDAYTLVLVVQHLRMSVLDWFIEEDLAQASHPKERMALRFDQMTK